MYTNETWKFVTRRGFKQIQYDLQCLLSNGYIKLINILIETRFGF